MDQDAWLKYYEDAPTAVQDYLLDSASAQNETRAQTKLAYDNDAWDRVMDVVWDTLFVQLSKGEFKRRLSALAGDRKPEDVEREVLFNVVLPLGDLASWDVETRLQELGVSNSSIQAVPRISLRPVSYGAAARRIASLAKISVLSEEVARRLRELLVSYVKGVRTADQLKEMLQRSQEEGGLGLAKAQAEAYANALVEFLDTNEVMSEEDYAQWYSDFQREGGAKPAATGKPRPATEGEGLPPAMPRSTGDGEALDQAIASAFQNAQLTGLDEYMTKRLQNIISTRLRGVRNAGQTKDILARDSKVGGLGLSAEEAGRVAEAIEKAYATFHDSIAQEEKKRIETTVTEQRSKIDERKKRESEEHAKWYREKVEAAGAGVSAEAKFAEALRQMASGTPPRPASVPPTNVASGPAVAPPKTMDSVVPPPARLVGLEEELGGMTLADFRRLAKSPEQAAEKIRQKLETLKQESFERWTQGVQTWRRSPLQQQYLKLVSESFSSGKPVAQLVEERRKEDPNLPTAEEIGAIISLNSQIQL